VIFCYTQVQYVTRRVEMELTLIATFDPVVPCTAELLTPH
jgi:hypothetical protein